MVEPQPGSGRGDLAVAAAFLAVATVVFQQTLTSFAAAGAASGGALSNAAFYPELVAGLMALLALMQIARVLRKGAAVGSGSGEPDSAPDASLARALFLAGLLLVYLVALKPIGYHIATPLFLLAAFLVLGLRPWVGLVLAPTLSLGASIVFEEGLNVILPVGRWGIGL